MIKNMRVLGVFQGVGRAAALSATVFCLTCVSEAAVPESSARQSNATGEYRAVVDRVVRLERELNDLQRATYSQLAQRRDPQAAADRGYAPDPGGNLAQRLSDMEASLRALTGRMEKLEYQMRQLETRVQRLANAAGAAAEGAPTAMTPPDNSGVGRSAPPSDAGTPSYPGAPRNLADSRPMRPQPGTPPGMDTPAQAGNPGPSGTPPPATGSQPSESSAAAPSGKTSLTGDQNRDFNAARELAMRGEFARAGEMFGAIAKAYPKWDRAGESQFWKGETLYVRELYKDAAEAYLTVAKDFPNSSKAPKSLLKLSLSFEKLGERKQACAALAQLDRRYPKAPEEVRQNAERAKKEFSCA